MTTSEIPSSYISAYNEALEMMNMFEDLEPTSALKQAAWSNGIPEGDELQKFVHWASTWY